MKRTMRLPSLIRWIGSVGIIFLVLLSLMRVVFYLYFNRQGHNAGQVTDAFFLGLRYDLRLISILLLVMLILGSLPWLHPFRSAQKRIRRFWLFIIAVAAFIALFFYAVDFAHYAYLLQRLNASVLNYLEDAAISSHMVWQSYPVIRIILGLVLGTLLIVWLARLTWRRISKNKTAVTRRVRITSFIISFLVLGFFIFGKFNQYPLRWSDAFDLGSDYKANLALNPFESFFNTLKFRHSRYDEKKVKGYFPLISQYYHIRHEQDSVLNYARKVMPPADSATVRPNVVLVICESFSGFKSSMWGNPLNTTPFFDSLCRQGLFFDRCFTPSYGTARGVWAVITGIPDVESSITTASRNPSAVDQHTIINDFTDYEKYYFIGGSASWANIRGVLKNNIHGLRLYEQQDYDAPKVDVWGVSDKNLFLSANKVLAQQQKPFFAVIQTADNHRPYTIPKEDQQEFAKVSLPQDSVSKYGFEEIDELNAFRYTDFCYRHFMNAARKEKYFDNTIFIFVGDHGIPGNAGGMFPNAWTGQQLTSEHVPLLFYSPRLIAPQRISRISSQLDVMPTAAGLCKIPYTNTTLGRDLRDTTFKDFAFIFDPEFNQYGIVKDSYFFRWQPATGKQELVSVLNNEDPGQLPGSGKTKDELRTLSEAIYETARYMILNNKKQQ